MLEKVYAKPSYWQITGLIFGTGVVCLFWIDTIILGYMQVGYWPYSENGWILFYPIEFWKFIHWPINRLYQLIEPIGSYPGYGKVDDLGASKIQITINYAYFSIAYFAWWFIIGSGLAVLWRKIIK